MKHFYHLFCGEDSAWFEPTAEHFAELHRSAFPSDVTVSVVGPAGRRAEVLQWLTRTQPDVSVIESDAGFEDITLNKVLEWAKTADPEAPVLYAHTKGSWHSDIVQMWWRRTMTEYLVTRWKERIVELQWNDIAAWNWLEPGNYGLSKEGVVREVRAPMAGGNFWLAQSGYVATLPELPVLTTETRYDAEAWIGTRKPRVACRTNQWPVVGESPWPSGPVSLEEMERELGLR